MNPKTYNRRLALCVLIALIFHSIIIFGYNHSMDYIWNPEGVFEKIIYMAITLCMWMFSILSSAQASDWMMKRIVHKEWKNFDIYVK